MFFFKSSTVLWQHHPPVTKHGATPAIPTRAPGLPGTPPPTLNLLISQHSDVLVWKRRISPQKTNFCTVRRDDIDSWAGRTTQALKIHREPTEDGRAPLELGPLGAAVGFRKSKRPLLLDGARLPCRWISAEGLLEVKLAQLLFGERHLLCLGECPWEGLSGIKQPINRQDVEQFSLKISTVIKLCPKCDSYRSLRLSLFLSGLLI